MSDRRKAISKKTRLTVFNKTNGRCAYCGCALEKKFFVDHVVPIRNSGTNNLGNLLAACL